MERSRARRAYQFLTLLLAFSVVSVGGLAVWGVSVFQSPGPLIAAADVVFPRGADLREISERLQQRGVIRRADVFQIAVRVLRKSRQLQAGEFRFPARVTPMEAMEILVNGETVVRRLTVPEGLISIEVLGIVAKAEGLEGQLPARGAKQGEFLPNTYHFSLGDRREDVLARMRAAMTETLQSLWKSREKGLPLVSAYEALILASIVERETAVPNERARIAGVFVNRLRRGMRLQSDPTVVYAVSGDGPPLGRALTREDLRIQHPYNTYTTRGLPPGPICNPGRDSLEAVMHPAITDELYFVADGRGGHAFAGTLEEHLKNVARWRRIQQDRK